jgi:hypothetical protein
VGPLFFENTGEKGAFSAFATMTHCLPHPWYLSKDKNKCFTVLG